MDDGSLALENVLIGNPFTSPVNQRTSTHNVAKALNIVDTYNLDSIAALRRRCEKAVSANISTAGDLCSETLDYVLEVGGGVFDKDARLFDYDYMAGAFKRPYLDYFNKSALLPEILKAIHIENSTKVPIFEASSERVAVAFDADQMIDYMAWYDYKLGEASPNILIYAG